MDTLQFAHFDSFDESRRKRDHIARRHVIKHYPKNAQYMWTPQCHHHFAAINERAYMRGQARVS